MSSYERPNVLQRAIRITLENYVVAVVTAATTFIFIPWWIVWWLLCLIGVVFVISVLASLADEWRPRIRVKPRGKAVFISGCDTGFGHDLAQALHDLGLVVFAGCLFPDKPGARALKRLSTERLHIVPLDVTSDESVQNALEYVKDHIGNNKFWALVNNAGLNSGGEFAWTSFDTLKYIFEVNTFGVVRMTKAFLPLLCRDKGRIVTVTSRVSRFTLPVLVPYCMSKYSTLSMCEGLRNELSTFGVKVVSIEPWMYPTHFTNSDHIMDYLTKEWEESPEEIKNMYPENYSEKFKGRLDKLKKYFMGGDPQEVVNCLEEAVMTFDPKNVYFPAPWYMKIGCWFFIKLPQSVKDCALHSFYYDDENINACYKLFGKM